MKIKKEQCSCCNRRDVDCVVVEIKPDSYYFIMCEDCIKKLDEEFYKCNHCGLTFIGKIEFNKAEINFSLCCGSTVTKYVVENWTAIPK